MNVDVEVLLLSSSLIISMINMVHNIIMATNGIIRVDMDINNGVQGDNNSGVQVVVDMALHRNITAIQVADIINPNHRLHHH